MEGTLLAEAQGRWVVVVRKRNMWGQTVAPASMYYVAESRRSFSERQSYPDKTCRFPLDWGRGIDGRPM